MTVESTAREIARKYDGFACWYDCVEGIPDLLGVSKLRRQLLLRASGRVLEVAIGTGKNLHYYPKVCKIIAVDISGEMLNVARKRAAQISMDVSFLLADAAALPFSTNSFDTVVSSLTTCTFPDPVSALQEMVRVCKPTGRILCLSMAAVIENGLDACRIAM